jgi:hypothetical protein
MGALANVFLGVRDDEREAWCKSGFLYFLPTESSNRSPSER